MAMNAPPTGPFLQAALFCEKVLIEADGVPSIIRVVDQIQHTIVGPAIPDPLPAITYPLNGFIAMKPGEARGRFDYSIVMERPNGTRLDVGAGSFTFSGGSHQGVNIPFQLSVVFDQEGLYWFDIMLDGRLVTRMSFLVTYQWIRSGQAPGT